MHSFSKYIFYSIPEAIKASAWHKFPGREIPQVRTLEKYCVLL
jgi:hypothetical protein